jgi:hypothetical protein
MRSLCHGIGFENRRVETVATALPSCNNRRLLMISPYRYLSANACAGLCWQVERRS